MTPLLDELIRLLEGWIPAFPQRRTGIRAITDAIALSLVLGRRTITRAICVKGDAYAPGWNTDYKVFSRSEWSPVDLFRPVWVEFAARYPQDPFIPIALDDTGIEKWGKSIPQVRWMRDPMSPPFQVNLIRGLRFVQAGLLFPHYREQDCPARSVPIAFEQAPHVKKPGKRATAAEHAAYREAVKVENLSVQGVRLMRQVRGEADQAGLSDRKTFFTIDGSYCNRTVFKAALDRTELVARCRRDAKLCWPSKPGSRKTYDPVKFTPEDILRDESIRFDTAFVYLAGRWRNVRFKQLRGVLWQGGAGSKPLRLIVIEPQPYRKNKSSRLRRRDPSFLLTTDLDCSAESLIQLYCDRWQIEVNHLEEKSIFGVGEAQVRSPRSVPRHPALAVAVYSILLLAGLRAFGPGRTDDYPLLPRWRRLSKRLSILDLLTLLRTEVQLIPLDPIPPPHEALDSDLRQRVRDVFIGTDARNLVDFAFT